MFIRINTKIQTTIFNLSLSTIKEKLELFNNLLKKEQIIVKSETKTPLFLSSLSILPSGDSDIYNASRFGNNLLFHDIIGIRSFNRANETLYKSNIFDVRRIVDSNYKYRNPRNDAKPTIVVEEVKTGELLKKYNNNDLKALGQKVEIHEGAARGGLKYATRQNSESRYLIPALEEVDHLMIIEGTCALSELGDVLNLMYQSGRNCVNRIYGLSEVFSCIEPSEILSNVCYKYGIPSGNPRAQLVLYQRQDKMDRPNYIEMANTSLFFENVDMHKLSSDELNVFIPYKLFIFMSNATKLFKDTTTLTVDNAVIDRPMAFTSQRIPYIVGHPKALDKDLLERKHYKQQTTGNLLPDLTTNNFKLKNTITYIPSNLSLRLLKSKLKLLEDKRMVLSEQGETIYNIPKSVLDGGYMEDFYFFTKEQIATINKAKEGLSRYYFNITSEHMVNLSYYTNGIYNYLLNRFANEFHNSTLRLYDFISCPRLLFNETPALKVLLKELDARHTSLSTTFNNDKITLLTREMFLYEKAVLLSLYLLKMTGKTDYNMSDKYNKNYKQSILDIVKGNDYQFTQDILRNADGSYDFSSIGSIRKAYLFETLYIACNEKTNEELIELVRQVVADTIVLVHRRVGNYTRQIKLEDAIRKFLIRTNGNPQGIHYHVSTYIERFIKDYFSVNDRIYYILSQEKSDKLLSMLLSEVVSLNHVKALRKELEFLPILMGYSNTPILVVDGKVTIPFLGDSKQQSAITSNVRSYNGRTEYLTKYPILFKTLGESHVAKNTDLGVFIDMLLTNFSTHYLCSIKHVECNKKV